MVLQEDNKTTDGADEQMLGTQETEALSGKKDDVKFTKNGDAQNGDAKIEMGVPYEGKDFTGMSKEELMKYANDPLWVRLRWMFFILFWLIWICMLIGAVLIIIGAPKCAAPEKLSWFKVGPLLRSGSFSFEPEILEKAKKVQASGVIYELPPEQTYEIGSNKELNAKIEDMVQNYKDSGYNIILDITPNYVPKDSNMFRNALEDDSKRSAFLWVESQKKPNNWLAHNNKPAWTEVTPGNYVLSQFGKDLLDLHMNSTIVKKALQNTLEQLIKMGIKGFRLKNSKYYILSRNLEDEVPAADSYEFTLDQYKFWAHTKTSFQEGLGDFLAEMRARVKAIDNHVMLTLTDDMVQPEIYRTKQGHFGIDTPQYGRLMHIINDGAESDKIYKEIKNIRKSIGNQTWVQWNLDELNENSDQDPSAIALFLALIPGVNVLPDDSHLVKDVAANIHKQINILRNSPSFMHGDFEIYKQGDLVAYSRIKSGSPGYFVVLNPSDEEIKTDFHAASFPEKMRVNIFSSNYNVTNITDKSQMNTNAITVSPKAAIILSYVPVKSK